MCEIKVDECFFDGPRKGEKVALQRVKHLYLCLIKSVDKAYTKIITDASGQILMPITAYKVIPFDSQPTINILKKSFFLNTKN